MKKVLLTLLGIIVVAGILAAAGFMGYRIGYKHGALASSAGTAQLAPWGKNFDPQDLPMHNFDKGFGSQRIPMHNFNRGFGPGGFGMMERGMRGGGFSSPFFFLVHVAIWVLIIWLVYKLIKGSGWKLSLTRQAVENPKVESTTTAQTK